MDHNILIVGVLDIPSSTNVFMKKGFEDLGYTVDAYNYRTRIQELGSLQAMWGDFAKHIKGKNYELILFSKVNELHPELITFANRYGPTWYWFMDNIEVATAVHAEEYAKRACFTSATSQESSEYLSKSNQSTFQIIEGFDPATYFYEDLEKIYDITFIGNATPKRIANISSLKAVIDNKDIHIFGSDWPEEFKANKPVYNKDERRVINQSKIVLNLCHSNIFSDRIVKSLACGALIISQYCEDLENTFDGIVPLYRDMNGAKYLIDANLNSEHDATRVSKFNKDYTWKSVCKKIIDKTLAYPSTKNIFEPAMTHDYRPNFLSYYVKHEHQSLLDVSCGKGAYLKYWRWKGLRYVAGTEGDPNLVEYNKKQGLECTLANLNDPEFKLDFLDNCFDVVTCTEVIEHILTPKRVIMELIRVAKKLVLITTPVGNSYASPDHINHWNNYVQLQEQALPACDHTIHEIVTKPEDWPMKQRCFLIVINK